MLTASKPQLTQHPSQDARPPLATERQRPWLIPLFWLVAVGLGAALALDSRHNIQPDGISYLDIGDAYWRGDWTTAINAFWSPLYPWIVGGVLFVVRPPAAWELTVVHFVNFGIFLVSLACFHFFMAQFMGHQRQALARPTDQSWISLPEWAWWFLGYSLCIWSSLTLVTVEVVTPDLLVAATLYRASGLLLRIFEQPERWLNFALLGVVLGIGYLAKAAMLPMAVIFLGASLLAAGRPRLWLPRALVTLALLALIAAPLVTALSIARGRLTFGESYRFNYALHVNRSMLVVLAVQLCVATSLPASRVLKDLARGQLVQQNAAAEVASGLHELGLRPGDPVVWIGNGMTAYWARLAHLRIIAEVLEPAIDRFSRAYTTLAPGVITASSRTGAKAIVAKEWPAHVHDSRWQRFGETSYYAYLLGNTGS